MYRETFMDISLPQSHQILKNLKKFYAIHYFNQSAFSKKYSNNKPHANFTDREIFHFLLHTFFVVVSFSIFITKKKKIKKKR